MNKLLLPATLRRPTTSLERRLEDFLSGKDEVLLGSDTRGYNQRADADNGSPILHTVDGVELSAMWREFQRTIELWNRQRDALVSLLTYKVTKNTETVRYPLHQDFEEASEFGVPQGQRLGPPFRMAFDFKWWDLATRFTWMYLAEATADELRALNNQAMEADNRLMFTKIMKRLFTNTGGTTVIDSETFNVYPFYNGDSMVPPTWKNTTFTSGHTHYLTSGATTIDSADIDDLVTHITHHGYGPASGATLLVLVNQQEGAVVRTFKVDNGDKYDFVPAQGFGGGVFLPQNGGLVAAPPATTIPGLTTIGTYGPVVFIEEDYIPAGYVVALATGGENNLNNPIGIREHARPELQGLLLKPGSQPDYPITESFYIHGFGTGVRHRGAGAVMQITDQSYSVPAAFA